VASGRSVAGSLAGQLLWVAALWLAGRAVLAHANRRLVVHGG
jgi:hypothetical protein